MKLGLTLLISLLFLSSASYAVPLVDFNISASRWQADYSGEVGQGSETATLKELGFDSDDHNTITLVFKHPVPIVPNVRLQRTDLSTDADGTLVRSLTIDNITFTASEDVATKLDLSHTDVTLFYSPLDNWVKFDIGLTGRLFDGEVEVVGSTSGTENVKLDEWLPMAYVGARFELPLSGLYLDATLNMISYDGNSLTDFTTALGYTNDGLGVDLFAELGYRSFSLEVDDINDLQGNIDIDGIYFTVGLQF
jgi:outer membrane protein